MLAILAWSQADPRGEIAAALEPYRDRLVPVHVDTVGIGFHLAHHLDDLGLPVAFVNVGETAQNSDRYRNRKAELLWNLRERFEAGAVAGLTDEVTTGQLAGLRYHHDPRGRVEIESKDEARRRGVRSPDRAEALMLAFAGTPFGVSQRTRIELPPERPIHPYDEQIRAAFPIIDELRLDPNRLTCRECRYFKPGAEYFRPCTVRRIETRAHETACSEFDARI